jgi:hypothetical protein
MKPNTSHRLPSEYDPQPPTRSERAAFWTAWAAVTAIIAALIAALSR